MELIDVNYLYNTAAHFTLLFQSVPKMSNRKVYYDICKNNISNSTTCNWCQNAPKLTQRCRMVFLSLILSKKIQ